MNPLRFLLLLGALLAASAVASAQPFVFPGPYGLGGYGFVAGGRVSYQRGGPGRGLRLGAGFLGGQLYTAPPWGPYYGPGFGRVGYLSITTVAAPPVVVINNPPPILFEGVRIRPDDVPLVPEVPRPLPPPPPPPAKKVDPPKKKEEAPPPPPKKPAPPRPPAVRDDPREEHARQVQLGKEAFASQEYGRAVLRFRQAIRIRGDQPLARFLLAQALLAQGKYHEAHDAIVAGLALDPDWPTARFRPLDLYDDAVAEYTHHLEVLEEALARHPHDPVLLFLRGYQLWFDGRQDEASRVFRRALPRVADRTVIDRFLRALPAGARL